MHNKKFMKYNRQKIERERVLKGWSRSTLAKKIGVNPSTISNLLAGKTGNIETIKKIADALGIDMKEICIDEEAAKSA